MAEIIPGLTTCSICDRAIEDGDIIVATTAFIENDQDRFAPYHDSAMHQECFQKWSMRERFVRRFNLEMRKMVRADGTYQEMRSDGSIEIKTRPNP